MLPLPASVPFQIVFPEIDPVLFSFEIFGIEIALRWYSLMYIGGLVVAWQVVAALCRRPALWGGDAPMAPAKADDLLTWMVIGVIAGGRLGFVLFYQPDYYLANPLEIPAIWRGGMSFHGGFIGVVVTVAIFAWRNGIEVLRLGDAVAAATPAGMILGRLGNFLNAELWGRPTTAPWGMIFPSWEAQVCPEGWIGVCARHPSQLYQAGLEGLALFLLVLWAIRRGWLHVPGRMIGLFLAGYGAARIIVEFFRQGDAQYVTLQNPWGLVIRFGSGIESWGFTMGQILSLPMLALGLWLILRRSRVAA
jgi:phosphatidylglycerol---prolipoprotein diacylglyceryl transferase